MSDAGQLTAPSELDGSRLIGQFVLAADQNRAPRGWRSEQIGKWFLGWHPRLPVIQLISEEGPLGWLMGYPISEEGRLLADGEVLRVAPESVESTAGLEALIYSFGGRYAVALVGRGYLRFYLDPCGSLSAVYCGHQRLLASTPNLIPYDELSRDRVELARAIGFPHKQGSYPAGLTPRYGVERLLPNHYLDLSVWQGVRHWPSAPLEEVSSVDATIAEIAAVTKRQMTAMVAAHPACLFLTAGEDSRMLLACARAVAERLELITFELNDECSAIDCDTAQRIARRFGLRHHTLEHMSATEEELREWVFRTGNAVGEVRGWQSTAMYRRLPQGRAFLVGNGGELGRGYWWEESDSESSRIAPERLVALCKCPPDAETLARAQAWIEDAPAAHALDLLALFLLEQDCGCWAGVWNYAECDPGFQLFPFSHRRTIELMLRLPIAYRRAGLLQRDIIAREWPALLEWPFSEFVGAGRMMFWAKRALRRALAALRAPLQAAQSLSPLEDL